MMFTKMKSMDTAFRQMRLFFFVLVVFVAMICSLVIYFSYAQLRDHKGKIYVMINGALVEAVARDRNMPVELHDHIERFHELFFTLSSDEKDIARQVKKSFYLADRSAEKLYNDLQESGYYKEIVTANMSQRIEIDSISINLEQAPYHFIFYGRQLITRPTSKVIRSLITQGQVRTDEKQSPNNPHGFKIERWTIIDNRDIKIIAR